MSVLPHGAEPITRQADLLLILHAVVRIRMILSLGLVAYSGLSALVPLFFILRPLASPVIVSRFLPPMLLWTAEAIVCPTSDHPIYAVQWEWTICLCVVGGVLVKKQFGENSFAFGCRIILNYTWSFFFSLSPGCSSWITFSFWLFVLVWDRSPWMMIND